MISAGGPTSLKRPQGRSAFTLVEMIVVMGIILVLITIVLPAVTRMWEDRKLADADNTIRGALRIARRTAMSPGSGDAGLLFALDANGVQRIYPIEQQGDPAVNATVRDLVCQNRFVISPGREYALLEPIRVVPRYAVVTEVMGQNEFRAFGAFELASNNLIPTLTGWQEAQRQRNHFTMIFSSDGKLSVGRDVLIYDEDLDNAGDGDGFGDRTGLPLPLPTDPPTAVTEYYPIESTVRQPRITIDPTGAGIGLQWLVVDNNDNAAINFPSVDGLLIYDDSLFTGMGAPTESVDEKREFLLRTAQPLYVAGVTATVIRGPLGENEVPGE